MGIRGLWILALSAAAVNGQTPAASIENDPDLPKLVCRVAIFAQQSGDLAGAEKLVRHGLTLFTRNNALETADGAACLTTLAGVLEWKGQLPQSQTELEHALKIREQSFGPNHFLVADTLNRLGQSHLHQGRTRVAEQMYERALEILRPDAPSVEFAAVLSNMGNAMAAEGRAKDAEERIRQAISMWEALGGPDDPSVAAGLMNLGVLLQARKQYDEAARLLSRAQKIDEKMFPANHPRLGRDLNAAGVLAADRKKYQEAEGLLIRSLAILESSLSPQHPEAGQVQLNLAEVYRLEKKLDQARDGFNRGLATVTAAWGPNDTRLAQWMDKFALVLRAEGDFAGAGEMEIRATRIRVIQTIR